MNAQPGLPIVISAPSGAGKTTLCRRLVGEVPNVVFSISHTTRQPRSHEREGVDYYFVEQKRFDELVQTGAMLEWAKVHDHRYGTGRMEVSDHLQHGRDVVFDIDVQGGTQIQAKLPSALLVFILPPDLKTLEKRLRARGSDSEAQIERRLAAAQAEIQAASGYTHWIVNDDLDVAFEQLRSVVIAERIVRRDRDALVRAVLEPSE